MRVRSGTQLRFVLGARNLFGRVEGVSVGQLSGSVAALARLNELRGDVGCFLRTVSFALVVGETATLEMVLPHWGLL
eukprot:CAMPEP_0170497536 /NCGR_PEP_ID=MMETSP0208-20121228/24989_1 /TAXON_ID=197538 /ORGANISM="Strombidium inclinatum, Strain S3" /LENGTH=76 /DNA_ID=CAMNT_0010774383 /DNA_START=301 /DNA_END=528 /DNA_ORIENTATION=-